MYYEYWGLKEAAFASGLSRRGFYRSPTHDEALARLHYLADEHRRLGLLLGSSGSGKTLLLEVFAAEVRRGATATGKVNLTGVDAHEFLWLLASSLGLVPKTTSSILHLWHGVSDRLAENRYQQINTVVLLDDADSAAPEVLEQIVRLAQIDPSPEARLTLVLAAAGHRLNDLGPRLLSLADLRIDLPPWEQLDTGEYICDALLRAGRDSPAFTRTALDRLHELSQGIPRRVNQLADLCLLAGAGQQLAIIDEHTVETVSEELGVSPLSLANAF